MWLASSPVDFNMAFLLFQVDVQSSRKDNEKLLIEIQALKMSKTLEDRRAENKALQASMLEQGAHEKEEHKVRLVFIEV